MFIRPKGAPLHISTRIPPPTEPLANPYLRTTLPLAQQLQPDLVKTSYLPAIPAIRILLPNPGASANTFSAAVQAQIQATVAPTPTPTPTPTFGQTYEVNSDGIFSSIYSINGIPI